MVIHVSRWAEKVQYPTVELKPVVALVQNTIMRITSPAASGTATLPPAPQRPVPPAIPRPIIYIPAVVEFTLTVTT
jgi:hypothetical protein